MLSEGVPRPRLQQNSDVAYRLLVSTRSVSTNEEILLTPQGTQLIHVDAALGLENLDDQSQPHRHFRGGDSDHKEHKDLSAEILEQTAKCHKRQVGRVEHQLNRHEDNKRISAGEHTYHADRKEDRRKNNVVIDRDHG